MGTKKNFKDFYIFSLDDVISQTDVAYNYINLLCEELKE